MENQIEKWRKHGNGDVIVGARALGSGFGLRAWG